MPDPSRRCLYPGCPRRVRLTRGLCQSHYRRAARSVAAGVTTWATPKAAGACLPDRPSLWREGRRLRLRPASGDPILSPRVT
jgi:hypothetical protein